MRDQAYVGTMVSALALLMSLTTGGCADEAADGDDQTEESRSSSSEDDEESSGKADAGKGKDAGSSKPSKPAKDLGEGDGEDVITIGDSWMLLSQGSGIQVSLEKVSMRDYRNYAAPGTRLLDEAIPKQYAKAKSENPDIKTVIMTGGGNDIIQGKPLDCVDSAFGDVCKAQIEMVADRLESFWAEMAEDGVRDVVVVGYTSKAYLFLPSASLAMSAAYSNELIPPLCAEVPEPLRCHAVDSDMVFDGKTREGIHPTDAGYDAIGEAVWDLMQSEGIRR